MSADAPAKCRVEPAALATWVRENGEHLYILTVTITEIEAVILRAGRIGATTKAEHLRRWLGAIEHFHAGRILSFGIKGARHACAMLDRARAHDPGLRVYRDRCHRRCTRLHRAYSQ